MKAEEMTFGVEFEVLVPVRWMQDNSFQVGGYHRGKPVPQLPAGWTAQHDGSLHADSYEFSGVEFVSPILRGTACFPKASAGTRASWSRRTTQHPPHASDYFRQNARMCAQTI